MLSFACPRRLLWVLSIVLLSLLLCLPVSRAGENDPLCSGVHLVNRTPSFALEVTIDGQGPHAIGRGQAKTVVLAGDGIIGEHELAARAYIPSQHFERCPVGKKLTVIFRVSKEPVSSPGGKVGWYRVFRYNDFFPNLESMPPEMYRKTGPRGFGHATHGRERFVARKETRKETDIGTLIRQASRKYRIPVALLTAVIEVESAFDARAVSRKGAMGLMQLMPATCARFSVHRPFDPAENVEGGARYLNYLLHEWALGYPSYRRMALALAAYHAGEKRVEYYGGIPPYRETRDYVRKVLERYKSLEET